MPRTTMIGTLIDGKYRITRELGRGSMGAVYEAEHAATGRRVAVKVITSNITQNPDLIGRFKQEALAAGRIETKHITQVLDAGVDRDSGSPFMVMEFLTGKDVAHLLKQLGPISPDLALRITAQACLGLQKAHEAGVVHRDIKPANLFLADSDGEIVVKVLDFGIAKVTLEHAQKTESAHLTHTGSLLGSPLYMSPEQARGSRTIDARADIWSLGATLYQCLAGRTPYQHVTALGELILAICSEPVPPIQQFAPWVTPEVAAIVHGCLRQNPNERFQTAKDLLTAIKPLLPQGHSIHEDMLISLSDSLREKSAERYSVPPMSPFTGTGGGALGSSPSAPPPPPSSPSPSPLSNSASLPGASSASTNVGTAVLAQSGSAAKPSYAAPTLFLAALLALSGISIAVYFIFFRGPDTPIPQPIVVTTPSHTESPTPKPSVMVTPIPSSAQSATPAEEDKTLRRVKVAIIPPDALVEVEGKSKPIKNGTLELEGRLGDVFRVRVRKGALNKEQEIIVTKDGPNVPLISLLAPAPTPSPAGGGPSTPKGTTTVF